LSAHYFVADAHLGAAPAASEERFARFLESIRGRADTLVIVGDLFDFWFEYGRAIPKHGFRVLVQLSELRRTGTRVIYLTGNHDIRFRGFFRETLGIETGTVFDETVDGLRVYARHGDETDTRPVSRLFRGLMRSRLNNFLYSFVHPDLGIGFAGWVAGRSRARKKDETLRNVMLDYARARMADGHDLVVLAHLHLPELVETPEGTYLNCGDWLTHFSCGVIRDGRPGLEFPEP
jgi:UDP-2,3-diacylglucosamine hydrolase